MGLITALGYPIPSSHGKPNGFPPTIDRTINMQPKAMDSMSLKIASFLRNAGIPATPESNLSVLVEYFEQQYGLNVMAFLENEWLTEQLDRDQASGELSDLWRLVAPDQREAFEADLAALKT